MPGQLYKLELFWNIQSLHTLFSSGPSLLLAWKLTRENWPGSVILSMLAIILPDISILMRGDNALFMVYPWVSCRPPSTPGPPSAWQSASLGPSPVNTGYKLTVVHFSCQAIKFWTIRGLTLFNIDKTFSEVYCQSPSRDFRLAEEAIVVWFSSHSNLISTNSSAINWAHRVSNQRTFCDFLFIDPRDLRKQCPTI